ncbi:hypothetical protein, partial [Petrimonas mucosa]|uniref:hypothetical protein n=1 Tax=Petrimonas mucosa TaxID=1642646 RepID=UPI0023F31FE8
PCGSPEGALEDHRLGCGEQPLLILPVIDKLYSRHLRKEMAVFYLRFIKKYGTALQLFRDQYLSMNGAIKDSSRSFQ